MSLRCSGGHKKIGLLKRTLPKFSHFTPLSSENFAARRAACGWAKPDPQCEPGPRRAHGPGQREALALDALDAHWRMEHTARSDWPAGQWSRPVSASSKVSPRVATRAAPLAGVRLATSLAGPLRR